MRFLTVGAFGILLVVMGCSESESFVSPEPAVEEEEEGTDEGGETDEVRQALPSESEGTGETSGNEEEVEEEGAGGEEDEDASESTEDLPDIVEEEEEEVEPADPTAAILLSPEELKGLFLYGLSAEMGTPLTQIGTTVAGVIAQAVVLDVTEDELQIRVFDVDDGEPVEGDSGVIESYPLEWTDDGQVSVSFEEPIVSLEVQLYQQCTYGMSSYGLIQNPLYEDELLTWGALEAYESTDCWQGGIDGSFGLNIHFLRKFGANQTYVPREVKEDSPFGFFQVQSLGSTTQLITRLPGATAEAGDGQLVYHIASEFPEKFRGAVNGVFQDWNDVFEDEVGIRPFVVKDAPAEMVPWDPRNRMIAWDGNQTLGAVAPFIEDPITGEMFSTYVLFWLADFQSMVESYEGYQEQYPDAPWTEFETTDTAMALPNWDDDSSLERRVLRRRAYPLRRLNMGEIREFKSRAAKELSGDELENFIIADFLSHELGHNLGLRHNFLGSADHENHVDSPSSTVMDYILGMGMPGQYDRGAVRYAYGDGEWSGAYLFCTDEDINSDPGCTPYDLGNPVEYWLGTLDKMAENLDVEASTNEVETKGQEQDWSTVFKRIRTFVNSMYETLGPAEEPVWTLEEVLGRIHCEEPCETHSWLRAEWALYLLYTQHFVGGGGGGGGGDWVAFPTYTAEQEAFLMESLFILVTNEEIPFTVRSAVVGKLPSTNLDSAPELVQNLTVYFTDQDSLSEEAETLLELLNE